MIDLRESAMRLKRKYEGWELEKSFDTGIDIAKRILDIDSDGEGNVYLTTIQDSTIHIFSPEGKVIRKLNEADGTEFNRCEFLKMHSEMNDLYVSDTLNNRLLLLSAKEFRVQKRCVFNEGKEKEQTIQAFDVDEVNNVWGSTQSAEGVGIYKLDKDFQLKEELFFEGIKSVRINSLHVLGNSIYLLVNSYRLDGKNTIYRITGDKIETVFQETKRLLYFFTVCEGSLFISVPRDEIRHRDFLKIDLDGNLIYEYRCSGEKIEAPAGIRFKNSKLYITGMDDGKVWILKRRI